MTPHNIHILVAEDDDFQRNILVELLRKLGINQITEASNGRDALAHLHHEKNPKIDIVFSDLKMPEMDGLEFLRRLGQENNKVEIVILSALDKKLLSAIIKISEIYKLNLLGTLEKPIGLTALKNVLANSGQLKPLETKPNKSEKICFTLDEILEGIKLKQFTPYLQPKIDLKTGQIIGAEALARWMHPEHGVIAPYAFISILEQNKKIDDLTFVMLKECATIYAMLLEKKQNMQIAINLSLVSLNDPTIAQRITSTIKENGGVPSRFTLEITESTAMTDEPVALENLARLSMNGFTLSIDDYGTGYSNLQQLTRINFGELKIDRSLVHGFAKNEHMQIIVASNIDMAHKLKMKCVAEGIETKQDWEQLREMDCDIGQGYYLAKPLSFADFYQYIDKYQAKPIASTPKEIQHFVHTNQQPNLNKKILVIEDDEFTLSIILQVLINLGYQKTTGVKNAKLAIDLFESDQFDLIFTDIHMPEINGLDLIKLIRTNKTLAKPNTRIVVLSGLTQSKAIGVAMALNVNGFIVKPLSSEVIESKIKDVISNPSHTQNPIAYETINTVL